MLKKKRENQIIGTRVFLWQWLNLKAYLHNQILHKNVYCLNLY